MLARPMTSHPDRAPGVHAGVVDPAGERVADLAQVLADLRGRLADHRLYRAIRTPRDLARFCEHHVVCVLDFMSLLKSLQRDLTCGEVPWTPRADPDSARLVLEIVLGEEADRRDDGTVTSHFAWYLEAMEQIGADTRPVRALVARLAAGDDLDAALAASALPPAARAFGRATAADLGRPLHERAAIFFHGREELIPEMFAPILAELAAAGLRCDRLAGYLARHVEVDGGDHGPRAARLLATLCGDDARRRASAAEAARAALTARLRLWDAVADALPATDRAADTPPGGRLAESAARRPG